MRGPDGPRDGPRAAGEDRPERPRHRSWFHPPSFRASLVIVALIPLLVAVGVSWTVVVAQSSSKREAVAARSASLELDSLLRARVSVYEEYVPSAAIVAAQANHLTEAQLDALLHIDFPADLVTARANVDAQASLRANGRFGSAAPERVVLRRAVDQKTATPLEIETYFYDLGARIDTAWTRTFDQLLDNSQSSDSLATRSRLTALGATFTAFTSGLGEESLQRGGSLETILASTATPQQIQSLVVNNEQFDVATETFPASLGPRGSAAWNALTSSRQDAAFSSYVQLAITIGLGHLPPPLAVDTSGIGDVARSEVAWADSLTALVLAGSADLRDATTSQAATSTRDLYLTIAAMALLLAAELTAVILLAREVRRPLDRIVAAATLVREGELEGPRLDETGPRELALAAAAFNEMSATLRTVQEQIVALSQVALDDPVLQRSLPGRTGAAVQSALTTLQSSVRANELRRADLTELATRDSLTGLLNRGAALETLRLDLASVHRSNGDLELTVLFIDLDGLKSINDTYGHRRGDAAIRAVADALKTASRASDVVARFGGDEFIVGSLEGRGFGAPELLARRIGDILSDLWFDVGDEPVAVRCSIGAAVSEPADDRVERLVERADRALYAAKANGRDQVSWSLVPGSHRGDADGDGSR